MKATTEFHVAKEGQYLLIRQSGVLDPASIKTARSQTEPLYDAEQLNRALVDYRQADLSQLSILDLDTLAREFHQDLPQCRFMALLYTSGTKTTQLTHIKNVCFLNGVNAELFEDFDQAEKWLAQEKPLSSLTSPREHSQ